MGSGQLSMYCMYCINDAIECVSAYKLLGVYLSSDPKWKWKCPVDYITRKVIQKVFSIRILKKVGATLHRVSW